jgi:hypothetical protein
MGYYEEIGGADAELAERPERSKRMLKVVIYGRRFGARPMVVRDISTSGLGGSTEQWLVRGESVEICLPNLGRVPGTIVWTDGKKFGVCFDIEVDAERVTRMHFMPRPFEVMDRYRPATSMRRPPLAIRG